MHERTVIVNWIKNFKDLLQANIKRIVKFAFKMQIPKKTPHEGNTCTHFVYGIKYVIQSRL